MRSFTALLVLVALAAPIDAYHCESYSTSQPELAAAGFYYDNDNFFPLGCFLVAGPDDRTGLCAVWIYQESNGIDGLQRQDESVDDTCHGMIQGDTIIF